MAIAKVQSSNFRPLKAGVEFVEVVLTDDTAATSGKISDVIPLGNSYRKIETISVTAALSGEVTSYSECSASAVVVDTASVKLLYKAPAGVTVTATFECEV